MFFTLFNTSNRGRLIFFPHVIALLIFPLFVINLHCLHLSGFVFYAEKNNRCTCLSLLLYIYIYIYVCVCVCVCV